jgi:uncharacterized membrane protein YeaQ/YmgE (transglycosylase-associated protein family)
MGIITWIIFGLIAGVIANVMDPAPSSGGILGAIVLGIAGALIGGFIANSIFGLDVNGFNIQSLAIAILGSMLLLMAQKLFFRRTNYID